MTRQSQAIFLIAMILISTGVLLPNAFANVTFNGDVIINTQQPIFHANYTQLTVTSLNVNGSGITMQYATAPIRHYQFGSASTSPTQFHVQLRNINQLETDWYVLTTGLTDVLGNVTGSKLSFLYVDGASTTFSWNGLYNHFIVGSGHLVREQFLQGVEIITAYLSDGVNFLYGSILQSNSTSSNNQFTLFSGVATIPGVANNQNFSAKDAILDFIVKKQYNYNVTSNPTLTMITNNKLVDCPSTGTGIDVQISTNETDGHRISTFTNPTCFANNTIKWSTIFTANGKSSSSYTTEVIAKIINATFGTTAPLKYNNTMVSTSFSTPYVISTSVPVGTGLQSKLFNWSMNMTVAPAYQPINYTAGSLSVNGSNTNKVPIQITPSIIDSNHTSLIITYPQPYNIDCNVALSIAQTNKTFTNLTPKPSGIGFSQSSINITNPGNDIINTKCWDTTGSKQNATNQLTTATNQIPLVQQILNFKNGTYGTHGQLGVIDLTTLIVLIFSMVGLNRVNETLGVVLSIMITGALSYFQIITFPTLMIPAIALIMLVTVGSTRKLPYS